MQCHWQSVTRVYNLLPLVVESSIPRKKSKNAVGVFQYAQTVENDAWDDAQRQRDIQVRSNQLAPLLISYHLRRNKYHALLSKML